MKINLSGIALESIVDGPGIRFVIFTQGCPHKCAGCHNPSTHDFNGGTLYDLEYITDELKKHPFMTGLTMSGGEPFCQPKEVLEIIKVFKGLYPRKNIIIYTGYLFEHLVSMNNQDITDILHLSDYLIDGPFILAKRDISLKFRGSSNQRIIDLKESFINNKVIEKEF